MMEATRKLESLAPAYATHEYGCNGVMNVSLPTPPFKDTAHIELRCPRCAIGIRQVFTREELRQLADAGIVTEDDVRRFVATTAA
jgi:hypothetical protein